MSSMDQVAERLAVDRISWKDKEGDLVWLRVVYAEESGSGYREATPGDLAAAGYFGPHEALDNVIAEARLNALTKLLASAAAERDEWRAAASMACENPPNRCDCAGCRFAEQYRAEEAERATLKEIP
jgi:hypothetical protein